jgi:hypothetical protein
MSDDNSDRWYSQISSAKTCVTKPSLFLIVWDNVVAAATLFHIAARTTVTIMFFACGKTIQRTYLLTI